MAKKKRAVDASAKRRTREHILEDLSVHHVTGLVIRCGYTVQKTTADYGYDAQFAEAYWLDIQDYAANQPNERSLR